MGKLNNTASLVARPPRHGCEHSIRVKAIENGFVTCISESNPSTGTYSSKEVFSKEMPKITAPQMKGERSRQALGEAVDLLNEVGSGIGDRRR